MTEYLTSNSLKVEVLIFGSWLEVLQSSTSW